MLITLFILLILAITGIGYSIYIVNKEEKCKCKKIKPRAAVDLSKRDIIEEDPDFGCCGLNFKPYLSELELEPELKPQFKIIPKGDKMNITQFDSKIAKAEKGKLQTHIGNVREVRKKIGDSISKISKKDLLAVAEKYNGKDLLTKIVKKLK